MKIEHILAIIFAVVVTLVLILSLLYWLLRDSEKLADRADLKHLSEDGEAKAAGKAIEKLVSTQKIFKSLGSGRIPIIPGCKDLVNALLEVDTKLADHVSCQFSVMQTLLDVMEKIMLENSDKEALMSELNELCIDILSIYHVISFRAQVAASGLHCDLLETDLRNCYKEIRGSCNDLLSVVRDYNLVDDGKCHAKLVKGIKLECKNKLNALQSQNYQDFSSLLAGFESSVVSSVELPQQNLG